MKSFEIPMLAMSLFGLCLSSSLDTPVVLADFTFGTPAGLGPVINGPGNDVIECLSSDGLEMYMDWYPEGGKSDLYVARRQTVGGDWGTPENLGALINTSNYNEAGASISADGLTLHFGSDQAGGYGSGDIWVTTRATKGAPWGAPVNVGQKVNSPAFDGYPWISANGLELYFVSYRAGGYGNADIWVAKRSTQNAPWADAVNLGPTVNTMYYENAPCVSADGLRLFFSEHRLAPFRPDSFGAGDLWVSMRPAINADWGPPVNLGPTINGPYTDVTPRLSHDGRSLYFSSLNRPDGYGVWDIWQAQIIPVVDFNGDGQVDGKEVLAMAEHWGQNNSPYDIGLSPLGDGVIDANDLIVLADYIGTEWVDPTLLAHWTLDEGAGSVAIDWAGRHDAMVAGNVVWQPEGKIGGALAFDGQSNFMRTMAPVLDPASGPFSVIAWVKGGATGRVIVSQVSGVDWLYLNQYGMLTTDLKASGTSGKSLTSDAFILDDQWHRVALTWDGTNRTLQMDGVEVARDTQPSLPASNGAMQMGVGKALAGGTYWSGLIDDVRIYNRAVQP